MREHQPQRQGQCQRQVTATVSGAAHQVLARRCHFGRSWRGSAGRVPGRRLAAQVRLAGLRPARKALTSLLRSSWALARLGAAPLHAPSFDALPVDSLRAFGACVSPPPAGGRWPLPSGEASATFRCRRRGATFGIVRQGPERRSAWLRVPNNAKDGTSRRALSKPPPRWQMAEHTSAGGAWLPHCSFRAAEGAMWRAWHPTDPGRPPPAARTRSTILWSRL